jgi:hypothetical protein
MGLAEANPGPELVEPRPVQWLENKAQYAMLKRIVATALIFLSLSVQAREMIACSMMSDALQQDCCCEVAVGCVQDGRSCDQMSGSGPCCITVVKSADYTLGGVVTSQTSQFEHLVFVHPPAEDLLSFAGAGHTSSLSRTPAFGAGTRTYLATARLRL